MDNTTAGTPTQHPSHKDRPAYAQGTDYADVADGLIGLAQALEAQARGLRRSARQVRAGSYLSDFAYQDGRNVRWEVMRVIERELPEAWDEATRRVSLQKYNAELAAKGGR